LAFIILVGIVKPLESTLTVIFEIAIFAVAFVVIDRGLNKKPHVIQKVLMRSSSFFRREDFAFALLIIVALTISAIFQSIGLSFILGSFFAGLIFHDGLIGRKMYERVSKTLSTMNRIFFIPLFFGFAGIEVLLASIDYFLYTGLALLIALALGIGVSLTYYVSRKVMHSKLDVSPKLLAGILGGRGAIGIVIATVALSEGTLNESGFSLVILATLIVSLIIPFLAGKKMRKEPEPPEQNTVPFTVG
jgi:Kef-type K+ transport system membrane component KefB